MNNFTLVMSASVNPNGMTGIPSQSIEGREDQYIRTLRFYRDQDCIPKILFVENSNWNLTHIKASVGDSEKIDYLSLDANTYPREWEKAMVNSSCWMPQSTISPRQRRICPYGGVYG